MARAIRGGAVGGRQPAWPAAGTVRNNPAGGATTSRPPAASLHEHAPAEVRAVARALGRTTDVLAAAAGDAAGHGRMQARAKALETRLAGMGVVSGAGRAAE